MRSDLNTGIGRGYIIKGKDITEDIKAKYGDYLFGLEYDPSGEVFWIIEPIYNSDIKSHAYSAIEIGKRIKEFFDVFPNRKGEHTVVVDYTIE